MPPAQRGFTLFELLIVLALIALASALVIPGVGRFLLPRYTPPAIDQLSAALARLRDDAILRRQPFRGFFDFAGQRLADVDGTTRLAMPAGLSLEDHPTQPVKRSPCVFRTDGSGCGQALLVSDGNITWQVIIDPVTGRIRSAIRPLTTDAVQP